MEEVDMPPPNYKNIFPSEHGGSIIGRGGHDGTGAARQMRDQNSVGVSPAVQGSSRRDGKRSRFLGTDNAATAEVSNLGMHSVSHNMPRSDKR